MTNRYVFSDQSEPWEFQIFDNNRFGGTMAQVTYSAQPIGEKIARSEDIVHLFRKAFSNLNRPEISSSVLLKLRWGVAIEFENVYETIDCVFALLDKHPVDANIHLNAFSLINHLLSPRPSHVNRLQPLLEKQILTKILNINYSNLQYAEYDKFGIFQFACMILYRHLRTAEDVKFHLEPLLNFLNYIFRDAKLRECKKIEDFVFHFLRIVNFNPTLIFNEGENVMNYMDYTVQRFPIQSLLFWQYLQNLFLRMYSDSCEKFFSAGGIYMLGSCVRIDPNGSRLLPIALNAFMVEAGRSIFCLLRHEEFLLMMLQLLDHKESLVKLRAGYILAQLLFGGSHEEWYVEEPSREIVLQKMNLNFENWDKEYFQVRIVELQGQT